MSVIVEVSAVIERSVEVVFQIHAAEHVSNHLRWDPYIQLEQIMDGPIGVGTMIKRINSHSGVAVEGTMEVIEFIRNQSLGMIIKDGPVDTHGFAIYEPKGLDQTIYTLKTNFVGLEKSVTKSDLTGQMVDAIQIHKRFIESEP